MNACDLIRLSDIALYKAKNTGRNNWVFTNPTWAKCPIQRREMEKEFREALCTRPVSAGFISPVTTLKPRVSLCCPKHWFRWQHPRLGLLMPDQFIPLAEETRLDRCHE